MAKILLVEDDDANRALLARLIRGEGYEVLTAGSFQDGRRLLRTEHPDLLITDVRLGEFNGLQLIVGAPDKTPTIVLTAYADAVIEAETRKAGARFLVKPVPAQTLLEAIWTTLEAVETAQTSQLSQHSQHSPEGRVPARPPRRWTRKPVTGGLPAQIGSFPARILDVSYGGLRLGMTRATPLPPSFHVRLPTGSLAVPVDLIWQSVSGYGAVECGVAVSSMNYETTLAWQGLVDTIPQTPT